MGNLIQDELATDAIEIMEELGYLATWKGDEYACVIAEPDVSIDLEDGGFLNTGSFSLKFLRAIFNDGAGPFPEDNDRITYGGKVYHVVANTNKVDSAYIKVTITP